MRVERQEKMTMSWSCGANGRKHERGHFRKGVQHESLKESGRLWEMASVWGWLQGRDCLEMKLEWWLVTVNVHFLSVPCPFLLGAASVPIHSG